MPDKIDRMSFDEQMDLIKRAAELAFNDATSEERKQFLADALDPFEDTQQIIDYVKSVYLGGFNSVTEYTIDLINNGTAHMSKYSAAAVIAMNSAVTKAIRIRLRESQLQFNIFDPVLNEFLDKNLGCTEEQMALMSDVLRRRFPDL